MINKLNKYDLNCNIFSVYDYDDLTVNELLCRFFTKINECIDTSNETKDLTSWLVNEGLTIEVANKISLMVKTGEIDKIINSNLFNELNNKLGNVELKLSNKLEGGQLTLNDFTEEDKSIILGLDSGNVNTVIGENNINEININNDSIYFSHLKGDGNLIDYKSINYNLIINKEGVETELNGHYSTNYIEVVPNATYTVSHFLPSLGAWYDNKKQFINKVLTQGEIGENYIIKAPSNAKYVKLNFMTSTAPPTVSSLYYGKQVLSNKKSFEKLLINDFNINDNTITYKHIKNAKPKLTNLIDKTKIRTNTMLDANGEEVIAGNENIWVTDYMPIDYNCKYTVKELLSRPGLWYDINKKVISWLPVNTTEPTTIEPPIGAYYCRWVGDTSCPIDTTMFIKGEEYPNYYIPFTPYERYELEGLELPNNTNKYEGLNHLILGDSISANKTVAEKFYHEYLKEELGFNSTNKAVSGSGWCVSSSTTDDLLNVINSTNGDFDIITIFSGTNDFGRTQNGVNSKPFGAYGDKTNSTFCGAVYQTLTRLINKFNDADIIVITPLPRETQNTPNIYNKTLKDYVDVIVQTCNDLSIPVIDLYRCSGLYVFNETFKNKYIPDGLHPNGLGHKIIANRVIENIKNYISYK